MATVANRIFAMTLLIALLYLITMWRLTSNQVNETKGNSKCNTLEVDSHGGDSHNNLNVTDEFIIILGYKLHPDGMATRVLRDRVLKAANLYKELMEQGHHPLIIVSGKGKSDTIGYTEAEVMLEWCIFFGIRKNDVLVDSESTNTAQNAKFSAELVNNTRKNIQKVYVVSSDYHIPRAQYIFQSVFPMNIKLDFTSSATPSDKLADMLQKEKVLMKASQDDLIKEGILDRDENGMHPLRTYPRWQMVAREIEDDIRDGVVSGDDANVAVADYGEDQDYFDALLALKFPRGVVVSLKEYGASPIDSSSELENPPNHQPPNHQPPNHQPPNHQRCQTAEVPAILFGELERVSQVYTYQVCIEVFDWFSALNTREEFEDTLAKWLFNSRTTFLELPEAMKYKGFEDQQNWMMINNWYNSRNESQILNDIARSHGFQVQLKFLGPILHDNGTVWKVLRVDVIGRTPHFNLNKAMEVYNCA